jgi:hypothetical protein
MGSIQQQRFMPVTSRIPPIQGRFIAGRNQAHIRSQTTPTLEVVNTDDRASTNSYRFHS